MKEYDIDDLESALIDILDGSTAWYDIQYNTGLSEDRCKEIEKLFYLVLKQYELKHNIKT
jgi:hypothetical protein